MSKHENKKSSCIPVVILSAVIAILIVIILMLLIDRKTEMPVPDAEGEAETEVIKNEGRISVPGYEILELKAESEIQSVILPNPPQNNCLFEISLHLADGTLLWKSDLIPPGEDSEPIVLNKKLPAGTYVDAYLHYDCYSEDPSHTQLNSAETLLTLLVY